MNFREYITEKIWKLGGKKFDTLKAAVDSTRIDSEDDDKINQLALKLGTTRQKVLAAIGKKKDDSLSNKKEQSRFSFPEETKYYKMQKMKLPSMELTEDGLNKLKSHLKHFVDDVGGHLGEYVYKQAGLNMKWTVLVSKRGERWFVWGHSGDWSFGQDGRVYKNHGNIRAAKYIYNDIVNKYFKDQVIANKLNNI